MMERLEKRLEKYVSDEACRLNEHLDNGVEEFVLNKLLDQLFDDLTQVYMNTEMPLTMKFLDSYLRRYSNVDSDQINNRIALLVVEVVQSGMIVDQHIAFISVGQYVLPYWNSCISRNHATQDCSVVATISQQANKVFNALSQYRPLDAALITSHTYAITLADFSSDASGLLQSLDISKSVESTLGPVLSYRFSPCEDQVLTVHCMLGLEPFSVTAYRLLVLLHSGFTGRLTLNKLSATHDSIGVQGLNSLHIKTNSRGCLSVRLGLAGPEVSLDTLDEYTWRTWLSSNIPNELFLVKDSIYG